MEFRFKSKNENFEYYVCFNNKKGCKSKKRVNIKTGEEEMTPHNSKCHQNPIENLKKKLAPKSTTETKASESEINKNLVFQNQKLMKELKEKKKKIKELENLIEEKNQEFISRKRAKKTKRINILRTLPSQINCCGRIHFRSKYRKHLDHCKLLPEILWDICSQCQRRCARAGDFISGSIEYFLQPHKCVKKNIRIHCSKKKEAIRKRKYRAMNPAGCWKSYLKFKYRNIGDAPTLMPLYKTAIILHIENNIRRSNLMFGPTKFALFFGSYSILKNIDYFAISKAIKISGFEESVQTYLDSLFYYKPFLNLFINHLTKQNGTGYRAKSNKQIYKCEFDQLDENTKYTYEVYMAYLKATNQLDKFNFHENLRQKLIPFSKDKHLLF